MSPKCPQNEKEKAGSPYFIGIPALIKQVMGIKNCYNHIFSILHIA